MTTPDTRLLRIYCPACGRPIHLDPDLIDIIDSDDPRSILLGLVRHCGASKCAVTTLITDHGDALEEWGITAAIVTSCNLGAAVEALAQNYLA